MPRRRYFGTITSLGKDSSGVKMWRLRWHEQGERKTETVHGAYRDAEKRLAVIHARVDDRKKRGPSVGELYEKYYLPHSAKDHAPDTRRKSESIWRVHVGPRWANVPVTSVKAPDVEEWLMALTPGGANGSLAMLRWIVRKAVMLGHIDTSPLEMPIDKPHERTRTITRDIITSAEFDAYYDAVRGTEIEAAWILCIGGGLRPGEALGTKLEDIEYREMNGTRFAAVSIDREAAQSGGVYIDDRDGGERLKTKTSNRWAIVWDPLAARLVELCDEARSRGDAFVTDDGFGRPQGVNWLRYKMRQIYDEAGLEWIPPRNLRASFATAAHHERSLPTEDVARLMGHAKPVITYGVYERPTLDQIIASVVKG